MIGSGVGEIAEAGAVLLGLNFLFSKGNGPRMGHNQHEKGMRTKSWTGMEA